MPNDNLAKLLDALTETSVYVIEADTHRILYFNRRCRDIGRGRAAIGVKCHEVWPEVCANCPLDGLGDKASHRLVCYDPLLRTTVDITADRIHWDERIPAIVVTATPHRLNFEEAQGLRKIEQLYAQSLVTVFDECIIANLTADYYVNCQKDKLWSDIPEQGNFGMENGQYARKVLHPDDMPLYTASFSRQALLKLFGAGKKVISRRLRRKTAQGGYHMAEFTAARIEQMGGAECWCVLVYRDIQEEFLLEQKRNVEVSQLATAAKAAYQMLIAVNLTQNSYRMLEYGRYPVDKPADEGCFDDLIAFELSTVRPDYREEFLRKFLRQSLIDAYTKGERIVTMRVPHLGQDGVYHWNFTQVVRVESPHTDDMLEITLSRNIDEELRLQQEALEKERKSKLILKDALEKAEKASKAKSDFLSKMSHDIRTPMNAIVGMTELAQLHPDDGQKMRDYLSKIASSSAHLLDLINEVLDVSKIESGAIQLEDAPFDLRALVADVAEMLRLPIQDKRQDFSLLMPGSLHAQVSGDARRLHQVLINILENASKYTGEQGRISLSVEECAKEDSQAGAYRFVIQDNGIGMRKAYLGHIFDPFSRADDSRTSKITGTGLGMTIVKNLVTLMGGTIEVESEYGKGSRFTVTLYLKKCSSAPPDGGPSEQPLAEDYVNLRVLLAEDNELNRQIATEMLELLGVQVEVALDGGQAVDAIHTHPPLYYDMVFMDIQMPRLNGYDAAKAIRKLQMERIDELPIVAMTADAFVEDVKLARLAGMDGHLAKPISLEQLKNALALCRQRKRRNAPYPSEQPPIP